MKKIISVGADGPPYSHTAPWRLDPLYPNFSGSLQAAGYGIYE